MKRKHGFALLLVTMCGLGLTTAWRVPEAKAQKGRAEHDWEYKVGVVSYNPGERLTDDQRARAFEKLLTDQARQGWEPVGSLLSRDNVQTVGGGVITRDTTSFVAYRRARR
ncbi:MAG: hypothetical protein JWN86_4060 [Planctomycetota bacterium]|nr:hypothetical protein [Planctomycetota bacterium]